MFECERCHTKNHEFLETVALIGEYYAKLCLRCRNEWNDWIETQPTGEKYAELRAYLEEQKLAAYTHADAPADFAHALKTLWRLERELRAVAREWVAAGAEEKA